MNTGIRYCPIHEGEYHSFNKHRNMCKDCKNKVPYVSSQKNTKPFNRKELLKTV